MTKSEQKGLPGLARLRKARGLSQQGLYGELYAIHHADAVSRGTIQNYENGATTPQLGHVVQLADFFQVSIDELVGRELAVSPASPAADEQTETETADRLLAAMQGRTEKAPRAQHPGSRKAG